MIPKGLKDSLNAIRELSIKNNKAYHQYVPILTDTSSITDLGQPILDVPVVMNEFISNLVNRIVYTKVLTKLYRNPLKILEGDGIPLGYAGQEIYTNPAKGRQFNINDFAGLLQKYESDVKVQYMTVNSDLQYPVTITRAKLKKAFVSWDSLNEFIDELTRSLYNGAYIDEYRNTKNIVVNAYLNNLVHMKVLNAPTTADMAKQFSTLVRTLFYDFTFPNQNYTAWSLAGGEGKPVVTWSEKEDIVFLVRSDILAFQDVNVLADAFHIDRAKFIPKIIAVDNFDVYNDDGTLIFDGSKILGIMSDKSFFRIKEQDRFLDEFYNPNNRTWQYYLNITKMYQFSLFSNAVLFVTEEPEIPITKLDYNDTSDIALEVGETEGLDINVTPPNANSKITYEDSESENNYIKITVNQDNDRHINIEALAPGTGTITAKSGNVSTSINYTITEATSYSLKKSTTKKSAIKESIIENLGVEGA